MDGDAYEFGGEGLEEVRRGKQVTMGPSESNPRAIRILISPGVPPQPGQIGVTGNGATAAACRDRASAAQRQAPSSTAQGPLPDTSRATCPEVQHPDRPDLLQHEVLPRGGTASFVRFASSVMLGLCQRVASHPL